MEIFLISGTEYLFGCSASNSIAYMYGYFIMETSSHTHYAFDKDLTFPLKCQRITCDIVSGDITIYYLY